MSDESGATLLLVVAVIPALLLNVLAALTAPRYSAMGVRVGAEDTREEPLGARLPYLVCRVIGHRRREEAPGIYFCPRCGGAVVGKSRH